MLEANEVLKDRSQLDSNEKMYLYIMEDDLEALEYITSCPDQINRADIHANKDWALQLCCMYNRTNILKYLCESNKLDNNLSLEIRGTAALSECIERNHIETFKYLCSLPDKGKLDVHLHKDELFKKCVYNDNNELINFLIFEVNIDKTQEISKFIKHKKTIKKLFTQRELQEKLTKNLTIHNTGIYKIKI